MGCVTRVDGWESDGGTPVLEVRDDVSAVPFGDGCKMGVESRKKLVGWVTRGEESEGDGGVVVTLDVSAPRLRDG